MNESNTFKQLYKKKEIIDYNHLGKIYRCRRYAKKHAQIKIVIQHKYLKK